MTQLWCLLSVRGLTSELFTLRMVSSRSLSAETGAAARPLGPGCEGFVSWAGKQAAGHSEAAAAGRLLRLQAVQRSDSVQTSNIWKQSCHRGKGEAQITSVTAATSTVAYKHRTEGKDNRRKIYYKDSVKHIDYLKESTFFPNQYISFSPIRSQRGQWHTKWLQLHPPATSPTNQKRCRKTQTGKMRERKNQGPRWKSLATWSQTRGKASPGSDWMVGWWMNGWIIVFFFLNSYSFVHCNMLYQLY